MAKKRALYKNISFSQETKKDDFYVYLSISDCVDSCNEDMERFIKCRTIGILYSDYGRYYLKDMQYNIKIQVSMVYQKVPPKSTVPPYPVQMFGELLWKKRPVIFAKIIQMMTPTIALQMKDTLESVTRMHRVDVEIPNPHEATIHPAEDGFDETLDISNVTKLESNGVLNIANEEKTVSELIKEKDRFKT